uniref:proton-conducting transporter transmembrane domain-containing protein n=1 Tax=Prescottella defluvii TaxID=1323361 RepID=UPI0004F32B81
VGAVLAVTQTDVKRMLAYSSVAHAGFILTGLIAGNEAGLSSTMFYLLAYGFSTVGAFAVVSLVRDRHGAEVTDLARWAGLGRTSPLLCSVFALFLLAFAGIPLTSGFVSKFAVFQAAASGGAVPLVIVGAPTSAPTIVVSSGPTVAAIAVAAAVTVILGVVPQPVLDLADRAASALL